MAKIPLRAYNREIETLIEQGHIDEATAHSRHILKTFPKCLDTYRLLGKGYLEGHRFTEAEDILKRLLLAVPDDFVGNLGMSIICDEQKNINNAIWHMERAFEVQPSNTAIQGELRRLYGRRDGLEPPQIRLTRGALAQMYARGNQIQQAIAEIRAMLAEDTGRMDLQVLLARVYWRGGQKVEATDTCTTLLKMYPYCLDANRIMVEILTESSRSDSTQIYRHRVNALDPYSAFVTGSLFAVADVPDAAVATEKLDFDAGAYTTPADLGFGTLAKTALGLSLGAEDAGTQDSSAQPSEEWRAGGQPEAAAAEEIPDWLKAAGWGAATAEAVQRAERSEREESLVSETSPDAADELAEGEMPEWLKSMAPPETAQTPGVDRQSQDLEAAQADTDWLAGLGAAGQETPASASDVTKVGMGVTGAVVAAAAAGMMDDTIKAGESPAEAAQPEAISTTPGAEGIGSELPAVEGEMPDWLQESISGETVAEAATPAEELPDWLTASSGEAVVPEMRSDTGDLGTLGVVAAAAALASNREEGEPAAEQATEAQSEMPAEQPSEDVSAWLAGLDQDDQAKADETANAETEAQVAAAATEFGSEPGTTPEETANEEPSRAPISEDDAFAWLEALAVKQGADPDELLTRPEERTGTAPDWLKQPEGGQPAPQTAEETSLPEQSEPTSELGVDQPSAEEPVPMAGAPQVDESVSQMNEDDAFAWLESLAAKQGANPEELLTKPEERGETAPEWLSQAEVPGLGEKLVTAAAAASVGAVLSNKDVPGEPAAEPPPAAMAEPVGEDMAWLEGIEQEGTAGEPGAQSLPVSEWLPVEPRAEEADGGEAEPAPESPAEEPMPAFSGEITRGPTDSESLPSGIEEMPDWLRTSLEESAVAPQGEGLPDWMAGPDEIAPQSEPASLAAEQNESEAGESEPVTTFGEAEPSSVEPGPVSGIEIARPTPPEGDDAIFEQAQIDLLRGNLDEAVKGYTRLIKKGRLLDEIIYDLREATYRHPVDVIIWLTLGDAYKRANRLQEALDAYTKAEELLR